MTTTLSPFKGKTITFPGAFSNIVFFIFRPYTQKLEKWLHVRNAFTSNACMSCAKAGKRAVKLPLDKPRGLNPDARIAFKVRTNNFYRFSIVPNTGYLPCEVTGMLQKSAHFCAY